MFHPLLERAIDPHRSHSLVCLFVLLYCIWLLVVPVVVQLLVLLLGEGSFAPPFFL